MSGPRKNFVRRRKYNNREKPGLIVESGEEIQIELPDFSGGLISRKSVADDLRTINFSKGYAMAGPIFVEGAERGDILEVEFLEFAHHGWGYTAIFPEVEAYNLADYPEDLSEPFIVFWDVQDGHAIWRKFNIRIPICPFLGLVGTAPLVSGSFNPLPPRTCGGNIDIKHLTAGSSLYLPVNVNGGLLFLGDPHMAQGDGEVFSSAIEAPLKATVRVTVRKALPYLEPPAYIVRQPRVQDIYKKGYIAFLGIAKTIDEATDIACIRALEYFCKKLNMTSQEAAIFLGVALDLTINEIPDRPNKVVSGIVPLSVFEGIRFP
jgi:acetamidase/formamidase